jgi:hypothetical protein
MASNSRGVNELAITQMLMGGVGLLAWLGLALLAYLRELPSHWPNEQSKLSEIVIVVLMLCWPVYVASGIGLRKRRGWARSLTMGLASVAGVLTIAGLVIVISLERTADYGAADFGLVVLFVGYNVGAFVRSRNVTFAGGGQESRE